MIGKKKLAAIRTSIRAAGKDFGQDIAACLDEKIRERHPVSPDKAREIETLNLIRSGLAAEESPPKPGRKRSRT